MISQKMCASLLYVKQPFIHIEMAIILVFCSLRPPIAAPSKRLRSNSNGCLRPNIVRKPAPPPAAYRSARCSMLSECQKFTASVIVSTSLVACLLLYEKPRKGSREARMDVVHLCKDIGIVPGPTSTAGAAPAPLRIRKVWAIALRCDGCSLERAAGNFCIDFEMGNLNNILVSSIVP